MEEDKLKEDIKMLKNRIEYHKFDPEEDNGRVSFMLEEIDQLENILNRLEQDERVIEEMESKLKEIQDEYLDFCPDCVDLANDLLKIIDHFRKKCE